MKVFPRIVVSPLLGALAGLAALALDEILAVLTLGYRIPLAPRFVVVYLAAGVLAGLAVEGVLLAFRRSWRPTLTVAAALASLYAAPIAERVHQAVRAGAVAAWAAAVVVVAGYALWTAVLRRIAGSAPPAFWLAATGAAAGLAINRNLVNLPLEARALAADVVLVAVVLAAAVAARVAGRRRAGALIGALAAAALATAALVVIVAPRPRVLSHPPPATPRPHLLMASIDTLRQDVFREVVDETPEGRAFRAALDGAAWFDNAIAAAPWTAPSVASIMTGLYPPEHGFGSSRTQDPGRPLTRLSDAVKPLAVHLRDAGFWTEGIVTNPLLHPVGGLGRGFLSYELLMGPTAKLPMVTVAMRAGLLPRDAYQPAAFVRRFLRHRLDELAAADSPLRRRPLFLWVHLMDPHAPLHAHDLPPAPGTDSATPEERLYRDETRYALAELTRMLELFKERGLWDDSVFLLVADHGEMFPGDGHVTEHPEHPSKVAGHGHALYEELVRIPLVIRPPGGLPAERRLDVLVSQTDLHDTVIDLLELDAPRVAEDRVSLAPWLAAAPPGDAPRRRFALMAGTNYGPPQRGVRTDTHKLIQRPDGFPDELYELAADPRERRDLAGRDGAELAELREVLDLAWTSLRHVSADDTRPMEIDEETRQRLKALGYLQ